MTNVLDAISTWAIPVVIAAVSLYAIIKKVPVYSEFTEGEIGRASCRERV